MGLYYPIPSPKPLTHTYNLLGIPIHSLFIRGLYRGYMGVKGYFILPSPDYWGSMYSPIMALSVTIYM